MAKKKEEQKQENLPAFPLDDVSISKIGEGYGVDDRYTGINIRDYFAAKAMQGLISTDIAAPMNEFAKRAYAVADEMLKERIKNEK